MNIEDVLKNLCYYDERNPNNTLEEFDGEDTDRNVSDVNRCFCDNCFYGRHRLAEYILEILDKK